jgi:sulfate transport system substrate-binding protein
MEIVLMNRFLSRLAAVLTVLLLPVAAAACGGPAEEGEASTGGGSKLSLVAYSTPKEAYEELIPAFQKSPEGEGVTFDQSYGASGDQSRAVESGLPADIVALSLAPDVDKLVEPGLVDANWAQDEYDGFVTNSVVVFAVRKGNPKNIRTWDDIVRDDVEVITPNPFTSGGAKWNLMAAYGSQTEQGKSPEEALEFLRKVLANTPVQDKSAREALQTFAGGKGDVLIAYENEALIAQRKGEDVEFVRPEETILIQNPAAALKDAKPAAQRFVDFLTTPPAQRIFARNGYRPVDSGLLDERQFPRPAKLFTIDRFGGWSKVNDEFFDPENGKVAKIEQDLGVSTAK